MNTKQKPCRLLTVQLVMLIGFIPLFLTSCSSSSDQSSTNTGPASYRLYNPQMLEAGFKETASIEGSDSDGNQYTGTYEVETFQPDILNGQFVIPVVTTLSMTQTGTNATFTSIETTYMVDLDTPFQKISEPITYDPDVISPLPASGIIGDHGSITSWLGSDNSRISGTWRLEDAGGGLANVVISSTTTDASTAVVLQYQDQILTVDTSGNSRTISLIITIPSQNVSYTLSGNFN